MTEKTAADLKGNTGIRRLINATRYSWQGIRTAFGKEEAFRQEFILAVILIPVAFFLPAAWSLKLWCIFSLIFLLVTELLNSGIEAVVDRIGPELHPLSGFAKDCGSAAVLFALIFVLIVWLVVLFTIIFG